MQKIAPALLAWFAHSRRNAPWRAPLGVPPNLYHVFLSEIMLQQTRVATMHDYFLRFIARWPNLPALADATLDELLLQWRGLGYYARARNLHQSAQRIMLEFSGKIPQDLQLLKSLKGVGDYTAAAIAAVGFNQPVVAIDGNIRRVAARFLRIETLLSDQEYARRFAIFMPQLGDSPYDKTQNGDMIQALMELGSLICTSRKPKCQECPIQFACQGQDIAMALPIMPPKIIPKIQYCVALIMRNDSHEILLERRAQKGLLGGMVGFPLGVLFTNPDHIDAKNVVLAETTITQNMVKYLPALPMKNINFLKNRPIKHIFTHIHLTVFLVEAEYNSADNANQSIAENYFWAQNHEIDHHPLPKLMQKIYSNIDLPLKTAGN